jgi:hypothetical protein
MRTMNARSGVRKGRSQDASPTNGPITRLGNGRAPRLARLSRTHRARSSATAAAAARWHADATSSRGPSRRVAPSRVAAATCRSADEANRATSRGCPGNFGEQSTHKTRVYAAPGEAAPDQPAPRSLPDRILLDIERPIARLQFAGAGVWYPQLARPSGEIADGLCFGSRLLRIIGQVENLNSPVAENCD